jgi:hypothetical protein
VRIKRPGIDNGVLLSVMLGSLVLGVTSALSGTQSVVSMDNTIVLPPVVANGVSYGSAKIRNNTKELIRCIGCSSVCSFGCTGPVGIPFDIPPHSERSLQVEYHAPNRTFTEPIDDKIELTVFFDHVDCHEMKLNVRFRVLPISTSGGVPLAVN